MAIVSPWFVVHQQGLFLSADSFNFFFSLTRNYMCYCYFRRVRICIENRTFLSSFLSVRLSFRMHQRGSHRTNFSWNLIFAILRKYAEELQIWLQSDKNIGHCTRRPEYVCAVDSGARCSVPLQQRKECPILAFPWQHSTVLHCWQLPAVQQQCKGKALLCFHNNSVYGNAPLGTLYVRCLSCCIRCLICNPCRGRKTYFIIRHFLWGESFLGSW